jgi:hypothetical protein
VLLPCAQAVIALSGGELIYFELDVMGQLMEVEKKDMSGDVACLDLAPVPEGRQRNRFLAVGSFDSTVRILSLDPDDALKVCVCLSGGLRNVCLPFLDCQCPFPFSVSELRVLGFRVASAAWGCGSASAMTTWRAGMWIPLSSSGVPTWRVLALPRRCWRCRLCSRRPTRC